MNPQLGQQNAREYIDRVQRLLPSTSWNWYRLIWFDLVWFWELYYCTLGVWNTVNNGMKKVNQHFHFIPCTVIILVRSFAPIIHKWNSLLRSLCLSESHLLAGSFALKHTAVLASLSFIQSSRNCALDTHNRSCVLLLREKRQKISLTPNKPIQ